MKKSLCVLVFAFAAFLLAAFGGTGQACVGRILRLGVVDNPNSRAIAELYVVLIAERTGTTAKPIYFKSDQLMYQAAAKDQLDFMIDDTDQAMAEAGAIGVRVSRSSAPEKTYLAMKEAFEKRLGLIWLQAFPVRGLGGRSALAAPVIRQKTLQNFPALPRVLNMLPRFMNMGSLEKLAAQTSSEARMKRAAENFLKERRLI
ncbi:MAG: hypothetical protein M0Z75_14425 [Nitrospiraceae bacterium]|nr:hypothetical protein [Nitrospiraceae bacterium]